MDLPCIANNDLHVQETPEKSSLCPAAGAWELVLDASLLLGASQLDMMKNIQTQRRTQTPKLMSDKGSTKWFGGPPWRSEIQSSKSSLVSKRRAQGLKGLDALGTYVRVQLGSQSFRTETATEQFSWSSGRASCL